MGVSNRHGNNLPHRNWLTEEECQLIVNFYEEHIEDGYRRCAYMMIDSDIVYAKPSTVYKVLCRRCAIRHWNRNASHKGKGFVQPLDVHDHWHMDITYIHIRGKPYYMITIIDGCSRFIVAWKLFTTMDSKDVGVVQQMAFERFPRAHPRYITDNGKQFIGNDFKEFIAMHGYTHVRTSVYYPQSNGKIERWHKSFKGECIHRKFLSDYDQASEEIEVYIDYYNEVRLHSATGYVTPRNRLEGRHTQIFAERERKLEEARLKRLQRVAILENGATLSLSDAIEDMSCESTKAETSKAANS